MKSNQISYEMLDDSLKAKLDLSIDTTLVKNYESIPSIRGSEDSSVYIIVDDDVYTNEDLEEENRKGYVYYAKNIGEEYSYIRTQEEIKFLSYNLFNSSPFAFKNHTHELIGDYKVRYEDIINLPENFHPSRHIHEKEDINYDFNILEDVKGKNNNILDNSAFFICNRYTAYEISQTSGQTSKIIFDRWKINANINSISIKDIGFNISLLSANTYLSQVINKESFCEDIYSLTSKDYTVSIDGKFENIKLISLYINEEKKGNLQNNTISFSIDFSLVTQDINLKLEFEPMDNNTEYSFDLYYVKLEKGSSKTNYELEDISITAVKCKKYYDTLYINEKQVSSKENGHILLSFNIPNYIKGQYKLYLLDDIILQCEDNLKSNIIFTKGMEITNSAIIENKKILFDTSSIAGLSKNIIDSNLNFRINNVALLLDKEI